MSKKIFLVRHGTTDWNRLGKIQGHTDIPLDDGGIQEIKEFSEKLIGLGIEKIISSTLTRAIQTANIIAQRLSVGAQSDPRLKECCFGEHEGLTREQVLEKFGEMAATAHSKDYKNYDFGFWGGENRRQVLDRHLFVLKDLLGCEENTVLLIGHGRGLNTLLVYFGQEPDLFRSDYRIIEID